MSVPPEVLVDYGRSFTFSERPGGRAATVELIAVPGPELTLTWGAVVLLDAWSPDFWPDDTHILLGIGRHPTALSVLHLPDPDGVTWPVSCATVLGRPDLVATWRPLVVNGKHFHLDIGSGLGAFADATSLDALHALADAGDHMAAIMRDTPQGSDRLTAVEVEGGVAAVVFGPSQGDWRYPAYAGYDDERVAVAVLVDFDWLDDSNLPDTDPPGGGHGPRAPVHGT